jgi:hypothetical protein
LTIITLSVSGCRTWYSGISYPSAAQRRTRYR